MGLLVLARTPRKRAVAGCTVWFIDEHCADMCFGADRSEAAVGDSPRVASNEVHAVIAHPSTRRQSIRFARRFVEVEDVVQEALLPASRAADAFESRSIRCAGSTGLWRTVTLEELAAAPSPDPQHMTLGHFLYDALFPRIIRIGDDGLCSTRIPSFGGGPR